MFNCIIAFGLLALGMYAGARVVDLLIARFNLSLNQDKGEDINSCLDYLPPDFDCDLHHTTQAVSNYDLEIVCSQVSENADGLAEGVSVIAEIAVGTVADAISGL